MSHEAVYTRVLCPPERRTGPSRDHAALEAHQTQAASTWWGSAPIRSWGWSALVDRPEDVDDRRVPGHWEGDLIIGNRWHLSGSDPGRAHHPVRDDSGSTRWGRNT